MAGAWPVAGAYLLAAQVPELLHAGEVWPAHLLPQSGRVAHLVVHVEGDVAETCRQDAAAGGTTHTNTYTHTHTLTWLRLQTRQRHGDVIRSVGGSVVVAVEDQRCCLPAVGAAAARHRHLVAAGHNSQSAAAPHRTVDPSSHLSLA